MDSYLLLKHLHQGCAALSITGFAVRAFWMLSDNPLLQRPMARVAPHVVDTVLLASALALVQQLQLWHPLPSWLVAKLVALLLYIGLGMLALRFGKTRTVRCVASCGALLSAGYILCVALAKSALGPLAWL